MKLTKNSKIFAVIGIVITVIYFPLLDWLIPRSERHGLIVVAAIAYGLAWFISGLLLGKADQNRNYRGDLGMLYHLITTAIVSVAAVAAVLLSNFGYKDMFWGIGIMLVSLLLHWLGTRNHPKGIDKKEAFK